MSTHFAVRDRSNNPDPEREPGLIDTSPLLRTYLVAQICPRWNRLADWLREAERYSAAA